MTFENVISDLNRRIFDKTMKKINCGVLLRIEQNQTEFTKTAEFKVNYVC